MPLSQLLADGDFRAVLDTACSRRPNSFAALVDDENRFLVHPNPEKIGSQLEDVDKYEVPRRSEPEFYYYFDTEDSWYYLAPLEHATSDGQHLWYVYRVASDSAPEVPDL